MWVNGYVKYARTCGKIEAEDFLFILLFILEMNFLFEGVVDISVSDARPIENLLGLWIQLLLSQFSLELNRPTLS
jgi:hypothetical protein